MKNQIRLLGAPSSAGAHAPGQEKAPALLRQAGILEHAFPTLVCKFKTWVICRGFRYRKDPSSPRARNIKDVVTNARRVADFVGETLVNGNKYIVFGGDCTNGAGAIAGATRDDSVRTGVIYLDMHGDSEYTRNRRIGRTGLDGGCSSMLGADGTVPEYANLDDRCPVLQNDQIVLLGWDYQGSNSDAEREAHYQAKD